MDGQSGNELLVLLLLDKLDNQSRDTAGSFDRVTRALALCDGGPRYAGQYAIGETSRKQAVCAEGHVVNCRFGPSKEREQDDRVVTSSKAPAFFPQCAREGADKKSASSWFTPDG